jgi:hypothetical protein
MPSDMFGNNLDIVFFYIVVIVINDGSQFDDILTVFI